MKQMNNQKYLRYRKQIFDEEVREYHYISRFSSYRIVDDRTVKFQAVTNHGEKINLQFDIVNEGIFRVRFDAFGHPIDTNKQTVMLAENKWKKCSLKINENKNELVLQTSKLLIKVSRNPWQISVYDKLRKEIFQESITDIFCMAPKFVVYPMGFYVDKKTGKRGVYESISVSPEEHFYGLGERFGPLDKKGQCIISWNMDTCETNSTDLSYKNIPFFMSTKGYGFFINSSYRISYEMGSSSFISYSFLVENSLMDYFFIYGPSQKEIINKYTQLTGRPSIPPKWSFGLWMSKNSYCSRGEVEEVCRKLRAFKIPCDVIHLDLDWLRNNKKLLFNACYDFDWDKKAFPHPEEMIQALKEKGFKVSLWENPFIYKKSKMYKEGKENGYFPIDEKGNVVYIDHPECRKRYTIVDFSNPEAVLWYQEKHRELLNIGIDVFKPDYGEFAPANAIYYNGLTGEEMHNIYPILYNRAIFEITKQFNGTGIVWARSGYAGIQRYPGNWSGDSQCRFSDLACVLRAGLSYGLSGVPFWSHDIGGYRGKPSMRLYIRWAQFGLLSPLARCHGTTPREPWEFGEEAVKIFRAYAKLRYRLISYLYSYAHIANQTGLPVMRAMVLEYPDDPNIHNHDLQYLLGRELLIAPIFDETDKRNVYLPEGKWIDYWNQNEYEGPVNISYKASLERMPIFVKGDSIIPFGPEMNYVGEKPCDPITLKIYLCTKAKFTLQDDKEKIHFQAVKEKNRIKFEISPSRHNYILLFSGIGVIKKVVMRGKELKRYPSYRSLEKGKRGWCINHRGELKVKFQSSKKSSLVLFCV